MSKVQKHLIAAGVRNLHEFGYPAANEKNILTDKIYSRLFSGMLDENKGQGFDADIDDVKAMIGPSP